MRFLKDFLKAVFQDIRWVMLIWVFSILSITCSANFIKPLGATTTAFAPVLETKIFVQNNKHPGGEYVEFHVPEAGKAILRLVNGAKVSAALDERMEGAEITINGDVVLKPTEFDKKTNFLKRLIALRQGTNTLGVKLPAQIGKRLSLQISTPADGIRLEPVLETISVGGLLQARAMLTGLGLPVPNAKIEFSIEGLGYSKKQTAITGRAGAAMTRLRGFKRAGNGKLIVKAINVEPNLSATYAVQVVERPSIKLESMVRAQLAPGVRRRVPFLIRLLKPWAENAEITFEHWIESDSGGITLTPSGPQAIKLPAARYATKLIEKTLEAFTPGVYNVIARATVKQTGETAGARMTVAVFEPRPENVPVINPPAFVPAAVTTNKPTSVRFAALARGWTKYPAALDLQEFAPESSHWKIVTDGQLRDNGRDGDLVAGDQIYARKLTVTGAAEGEKRYRVMFSKSGKPDDYTIVSSDRALKITRFPVGAAEGKYTVIEDGKTGRKFVAAQVTARFIPGVTEERIQAIVESATEEATGKAGHVIGYLSQIRVVQVGLEVKVAPGTPEPEAEAAQVAAVKAAVAELERYEEVRHAQPNFVFEFAQLPEVTPDGEDDGVDPVICTNVKQEQWGAIKIKAHESWPIAGTLSGPKLVAVVDTGVKPSSDPSGDLCWGATTAAHLIDREPKNCDPVNVLGDTDLTANAEHGTGVAGIIAARHHGSSAPIGISGIAHGLPIHSFDVGTNLFHEGDPNGDGITRASKILDAADTLEVGIINISVGDDDLDPDFLSALEYATCPDDTPGDTDCDCESDGTGRCRLVVAAAGNFGDPSDAPYDSYPCAWNLDAVLCVANTDKNDQLNTLSNYGTWVDLTAPGTQICTTNAVINPSDPVYHALYGTSFAVPHVAGAAAVLWSKKPDMTAREVADRLKNTADPIDGINTTSCGGASCAEKLGEGRLNLHAAVRYPARLVLVLDKSGSMAWSSHPTTPGCEGYGPPSGTCGPSRWTILKRAVDQMLAVADSYALPDDEFAVALFDSDVSASNQSVFTGPGSVISTGTFVSDPARTPGGGTSIGAGVTAFDLSDASGYLQTILLFTDGDQNQPPYLVPNASQVFINETDNSTSGSDVYEFAPGVSICPFAMRTDNVSGTLYDYFQSIANQRCDDLIASAISIDPSDPDLEQFFLQVLHRALIGDKLELLQVTSGQIKRGGNSFDSETFTTSRDDLAFTLLITWPEPGNGLKQVVLSKDGVDFPVIGAPNRIHTSSGDTYMAITLRQPYCRRDGKCVKSEGEWTLHMQPSFEVTDRFTYNLFVTADNASLASEFRVSQPEPGVGRPLRITASLTEAGKPIQGLPPGSVRAVLSRPQASLGNVLSKAQVEPIKGPDADPISAAGRKASAMLADPGLRASILAAIQPSVETELILKESEPGLYEDSYYDTKVSGIYNVRFLVEGQSAGNGKFTRTYSTARSVEVMADEEATRRTIKVSTITPCQHPEGCYAINLTPLDAAGNLLGPGKASMIKVVRFTGQFLNPISDELDGSYTIRLGYPNPRSDNPVIVIQGTRIPVDLDKLSSPSSLRIYSESK